MYQVSTVYFYSTMSCIIILQDSGLLRESCKMVVSSETAYVQMYNSDVVYDKLKVN